MASKTYKLSPHPRIRLSAGGNVCKGIPHREHFPSLPKAFTPSGRPTFSKIKFQKLEILRVYKHIFFFLGKFAPRTITTHDLASSFPYPMPVFSSLNLLLTHPNPSLTRLSITNVAFLTVFSL